MTKRRKDKFYADLDKLFLVQVDLLNRFAKSSALQECLYDAFTSIVYGNLIANFFKNLTSINLKEADIAGSTALAMKSYFAAMQEEIHLVISSSLLDKKIDESYYRNFKSVMERKFPQFIVLISEIEKEVDIVFLRRYLRKKKKDIHKTGKPLPDLMTILMTNTFEVYLLWKKRIPTMTELGEIMGPALKQSLSEIAMEVMNRLKKKAPRMVTEQRRYQKTFESKIYRHWKDALDLFESMIKVCTEVGEAKKNALSKGTDNSNVIKRSALIQIHARSLLITNEILALLKAGYADGANSRWRSLHELAVISIFLSQHDNEVAKRYFEHELIKGYKDAKDYQVYSVNLGYTPLSEHEIRAIEEQRDSLIQRYGEDFAKSDYGWIPKTILSDGNFRALEKFAKLDKLHPFYNMSTNSVHGGARGFYHLGLTDSLRGKILLVGPSIFGLADPIANSAISLGHITFSLVNIEHDLHSLVQLAVVGQYVKQVLDAAQKAHNKLE